MTFGRLAIPVLIVMSVVLVGGAALALAGALPPRQAAPAPAPQVSPEDPTPAPTDPPVKSSSGAGGEVSITGGINNIENTGEQESKPAPKPGGDTSSKSGSTGSSKDGQGSGVQGKSDSPPSESSVQPRSQFGSRSESGDDASKGSTASTVYTWHDGDREMRTVLQGDLVVQDTSANSADDVLVVKSGSSSIVQKQPKHGSGSKPVFRSESGGGLMTLPGDVILILDESWDEATVEEFFEKNGITQDDVTGIEFLDNAYVVKTAAGFPSLDLANVLHGQEGVVASSPNWSRERVAK